LPAAKINCEALFPWITEPEKRFIAIVGLSKNAGKTTLLNALVKAYPRVAWGVMTTGRDGESTDVLFKTPKPRVELHEGCLFCSDTPSLEILGSAVSILTATPWQKAGKKLYLARCQSDLATEISGPGTAKAQAECAALLRKAGAKKVLIDGSLDRKSIVLEGKMDGLILVAGASLGTMPEIIGELKRLLTLSSLPVEAKLSTHAKARLLYSGTIMLRQKRLWQDTGISSLIGREKQLLAMLDEVDADCSLYIPGAYTTSLHHRLGLHFRKIHLLFRHPGCIMLGAGELERFLVEQQPKTLLPFIINGIAINSSGVGSDSHDAELFRHELRSAFPAFQLPDLMEI